jgi:hypothetical protein
MLLLGIGVGKKNSNQRKPPWLARELEPNEKVFSFHLSSIPHGVPMADCWFTRSGPIVLSL